jgi:hypothetical protein
MNVFGAAVKTGLFIPLGAASSTMMVPSGVRLTNEIGPHLGGQ